MFTFKRNALSAVLFQDDVLDSLLYVRRIEIHGHAPPEKIDGPALRVWHPVQ
jgi:hypothetical protein